MHNRHDIYIIHKHGNIYIQMDIYLLLCDRLRLCNSRTDGYCFVALRNKADLSAQDENEEGGGAFMRKTEELSGGRRRDFDEEGGGTSTRKAEGLS